MRSTLRLVVYGCTWCLSMTTVQSVSRLVFLKSYLHPGTQGGQIHKSVYRTQRPDKMEMSRNENTWCMACSSEVRGGLDGA